MFGILQVCTVTGLKHWVKPGSFMAASKGYGAGSLVYADRAAAEVDAERLRADNARKVESTKRSRKFKTHPATYTIIENPKTATLPETARAWA